MSARVVVQRVDSASLLLVWLRCGGGEAVAVVLIESVDRWLQDNVDEWGSIGPGLIVYVCFLRGATEEVVDKIVNLVTGTKIYADADGRKAVLEGAVSVMLIPQASLGGKAKGKHVQYHDDVGKQQGAELYQRLVERLREVVPGAAGSFVAGTFGNRQGLKLESRGPDSHFFEL